MCSLCVFWCRERIRSVFKLYHQCKKDHPESYYAFEIERPKKPAGTEVHHFATDKNKTYTDDFKSITDKYALDLDGDWNKERLPHKGKHDYSYHKFVLDEMTKIDQIAKGNQEIFLDLYEENVKSVIRANPEMMYADYWKHHKYMQRAILSYYKRILNNEETSFLELLKYSFDIDGLDGQLIIVTHSTDALIDSHKNIIRFYKNKDKKTVAISGMDMMIKSDIEKHLLMHFSDIKEAFYSKCVLIVEGETEYGCIRGFAKTLRVSLDDYGICFINAQGEGSIPKLQRLFDHFAIPTVVIFDADVKQGKQVEPNQFFTSEICFEMDIVSKLIELKKIDLLNEIVLQFDSNANKHELDTYFVKKPFQKIDYDLSNYTPKKLEDLDITNEEEYKAVFFAWYYAKKGILMGKIIGDILSIDCIPSCYTDAIAKAKEVASL